MKTHTLIGADILAGSNFELIKMGRVIALTHHEKWDGSGYPRGLKGPKIPLVARIVAVADVFDALTSERPYKAAFSVEKSNRIIADGKGSHFDPDVAEAFFSIQDTILGIKDRYRDKESEIQRLAASAANFR
jgi:putative two-component system response regulator